MDGGGAAAWEIEGIEELAKEDCLMRGVVQGDVFSVASRVSNESLFLQAPGNHPCTVLFLFFVSMDLSTIVVYQVYL